MKKLLLLLLIPLSVQAEPFISVGLGVHSSGMDEPEINLDIPLGIVEAGYQFDSGFNVKYTHISGLTTKELGFGLNMLSINYIWRF